MNKFKGVARYYLTSGSTIDVPCDDVIVELGLDGFITNVEYKGNLLTKDIPIKFMNRTQIIAVVFVKNEGD